LPAKAYREPVLRALAQKDGTASPAEVVEAVGHELNDRLTPTDRQELSTGTTRWRNRVSWMRFQLANEGLIAKGSPRGTWALTQAGWEAAKAAESDLPG
jgi:restriction endonuclease Mrr